MKSEKGETVTNKKTNKITKTDKVVKPTKKEPEQYSKTNIDKKANEVVLLAIKKKYGSVLSTLNDSSSNIETVSTGSLSLDLALGRGGMALGRIYEVFGPPSCGKSTLGVHVVIQAQRRGMKCAYIDAEQAVDPILFKNYGVKADELDVIQAYGGEPNLDILERLVRTENYSVIVIDSVSALIPMQEAENDMDKDTMALQARLMSKALRKITPQSAKTNTLLIFVNQTRQKVGSYGNPEVTTGGGALGFWSTGRISIKGPEAKSRRLVDKSGAVYGHAAEHEIVKNKLGEPFKKASLNLIYGKGYDFYQEILDMSVSLDIVEKAGSWFRYEDENIGQGTENCIECFRQNKDFFNSVRNKVIAAVNLKEAYELHRNPGPLYS